MSMASATQGHSQNFFTDYYRKFTHCAVPVQLGRLNLTHFFRRAVYPFIPPVADSKNNGGDAPPLFVSEFVSLKMFPHTKHV